jgi:hypothetical protein
MDKRTLGILIGAGAAFLLWKKKSGAAGAAQGALAPATGGDPSYGPLNVYQENTGPSAVGVDGTAGTLKTVKLVTTIGTTAAAFIPVAGPFISAGIAAAGAIASVIIGATAGKPLDSVNAILIAEMPYGYAGRTNVPPAARIYALDRYGWLWPLKAVNECGWSWREVIAVNWKVFSMFPRGAQEVCDVRAIDPIPRSADPSVLRSLFGNDIRFKLGASNDDHGPWEGQTVLPAPGSPAMWAELAGSYKPTVTASPGEFG